MTSSMKTKARAQRGVNKKRSHGDDGPENYTPQPTARRRNSSSNPRGGHQHQGDHQTLQAVPVASPCTELATHEETLTILDKSGGKSSSSLQPQPAQAQPDQVCYQRGKSENGGRSCVQNSPTSNVDAGQAMGPFNDLVLELGCDFLSQAAQFEKLLEGDASNRASRKSDLGNLSRSINLIKFDRNISIPEKFRRIWFEVRTFADLQEKKIETEIANLKQEGQFCMAKLVHIRHLEIDGLQQKCRSLSESRSVLQKDNEVLEKKIQNIPEFEVLYRHLDVNVEAAENSDHEAKRGFQEFLKEMTQGEILNKILSLGEISQGLNLELQKRSHEQESSRGKLIQWKPGRANGRHGQKSHHERQSYVKLKPGEANGHEQFHSAKSGSYTDEAATPILLDQAVFNTRADVASFQKVFLEVLKILQENPWDLSGFDRFFARNNHLGFYVRSAVNECFFEGFENESFNTLSGVSRFLDPGHRQTKYYQYFKNNTGDIDDPQFRDFCRAKVSSLWKMFFEYDGESPKVCCCFEELGGPELGLQLASSFKAAARSVWLLHKLSFSFEPPASIFRVERGADVDAHYMETVVKLEDNERFVSKVGFMITPGLRLGKTVVRSEVYLDMNDSP